MQGYRTILALVIQFAVSMGYISQGDATEGLDAIFAIVSAVVTLIGIYYKVQANVRENKLKIENNTLSERLVSTLK